MIFLLDLPPVDNPITPVIEIRQRYEQVREDSEWNEYDSIRVRYGAVIDFGGGFDGHLIGQHADYDTDTSLFLAPTPENDLWETWVRWKEKRQSIKIGRQTVNKGRGRLLSENDWDELGYTWDAVRWQKGYWDFFLGNLATDTLSQDVSLGFLAYRWSGGETTLIRKVDDHNSIDTQNWTLTHEAEFKAGEYDGYTIAAVQEGEIFAAHVSSFMLGVELSQKLRKSLDVAAFYEVSSIIDSDDDAYGFFDDLYGARDERLFRRRRSFDFNRVNADYYGVRADWLVNSRVNTHFRLSKLDMRGPRNTEFDLPYGGSFSGPPGIELALSGEYEAADGLVLALGISYLSSTDTEDTLFGYASLNFKM